MPNLFICLTPLQALIAQQLIKQKNQQPAHLLMMCYNGEFSEKFNFYYQNTASLCEHSFFCFISQKKWRTILTLHHILHKCAQEYDTVFIANIQNSYIQYFISKLDFNYIETFDDGLGNLYQDSIFYQNSTHSWARKFINRLIGIHYKTEDLRHLSRLHHTLYPQLPNIVSPTTAINLWNLSSKANQACTKIQKILLGQPIFKKDNENIKFFTQIISHIHPDVYFPHPRETHKIPKIKYINTPLIFEDFLQKEILKHPEVEFHIYHLASTAALNVQAFPHIRVFALRPDMEFFKQSSLNNIYMIMEQLNIPIEILPNIKM